MSEPCPNCGMYNNEKDKKPEKGTDEAIVSTEGKHFFGMRGWVCPNCNSGCSPYTSVCPVCKPTFYNGMMVLSYSQSQNLGIGTCICGQFTGVCPVHGGVGAGSAG